MARPTEKYIKKITFVESERDRVTTLVENGERSVTIPIDIYEELLSAYKLAAHTEFSAESWRKDHQ